MSLEKNKSHYSKFAKLLHWGFVILFVYGVAKQVDNINQLEDIAFFRFEIYFTLIFLFLLFIRFIYMKKTQRSSIPDDTPRVQKMAAKFVHNGMYILLAATVFSGLLIGLIFSLNLKNTLVINITIRIHEIVINLLYFLILIHVIAAIYHRLKKDGVWNSMVPFLREKKD